jgi:hypothetical protein
LVCWTLRLLRLTLAPFQRHSLVRQEHGRTIPLRDIGVIESPQRNKVPLHG